MVATNDIGAEVAKLLTGPAWSGHRVIELGSMVSADEVAEQLGEVLKRDVKAFAVPRAGWAEAFEQFGVPKGHTGPAEEMFEAVNAGWMDARNHGCGARSGYDVRTRCFRGCSQIRRGESGHDSPFREVQPADRRNRSPGHGDDAQLSAPSGLRQRPGGRGQPWPPRLRVRRLLLPLPRKAK